MIGNMYKQGVQHMIRKLSALLLAVMMTVGLLPAGVFALNGGLSGSGTETDPYIIEDAADWNAFAENVENGVGCAAYYKLSDDFDNSAEPIAVPVGTGEHPFTGVFDGNGRTLSVNLVDENSSQGYAPFREIGGAVIRNLTVTGTVNTAGWHCAGLVGFARDGSEDEPNTIENCNISVSVIGSDYKGGVVGHGSHSYLKIKDTIFSGVIADREGYYGGYDYTGGFMGWSDGNHLTVENCLFSGSYSGTGKFHPIAIQVDGAGTEAVFNGAYYTEPPTFENDGHIVGDGVMVMLSAPTDGLAKNVASGFGTLYAVGETKAEAGPYAYTGEAITVAPKVTFDRTELTAGTDYTFVIEGQNGHTVTDRGTYTVAVTGAGAYSGSFSFEFSVITDLIGAGTETDPYLIRDAADWITFAEDVSEGRSFIGEYVKLLADINVTDKVGVVSGGSQEKPFSGIFDGGSNTITVNIEEDNGDQGTALFCYINGAVITNLTVVGTVKNTSAYHAAGLVGFARSVDANGENTLENRIENCFVAVNVEGGDYIGGILGHGLDSNITIENCVFSGTLIGGGNAKGALFGWGDDGGDKLVTDCIYLFPAGQNTDNLDLVYFSGGSVMTTRVYKTTGVGDHGTRVYTEAPNEGLYKRVTILDSTVYVPNLIAYVGSYAYTGSEIAASPIVYFENQRLTEGTDYTFMVSPEPVQEAGSYTLTVTGIDPYAGSETLEFRVLGDVEYVDSDGSVKTVEALGYAVLEDQTELINGWYVVCGDSATWDRLMVLGDDVKLILVDGYTLMAPDGISVPAGKGLTIYGQEENTGRLLITNGEVDDNNAAIGGDNGPAGSITICGGDITVKGGSGGAGIGGGSGSAGGTINIYGGSVRAEGGDQGAGIGGGMNGSAGTINIYGGTVSASGGWGAADIGGGNGNSAGGGSITISGGRVEANGSGTYGIGAGSGNEGQATAISLGWTDSEDYIETNKEYCGSVTMLNAMRPMWSEDILEPGAVENDRINCTKLIPYYRFTVKFDKNGGTGDDMADQEFIYGIYQYLSGNAYSREGYSFAGWSTRPDGYGAMYGDGEYVGNLSSDVNGTVTLYAIWHEYGAPEMCFEMAELRGNEYSDQKNDLRFVFRVDLYSTRVLAGTEYYGSADPAFELTAMRVRYRKGGEAWSDGYVAIKKLFYIADWGDYLLFTVVFVNVPHKNDAALYSLAAEYAYRGVNDSGTGEYHRGVVVATSIDGVRNSDSPVYPDFPLN